MNREKFSAAMGELNDRYVSEAISYRGHHRRNFWLKWASAAACLCLIFGGIYALPIWRCGSSAPNSEGASRPGEGAVESDLFLTAYAIEEDHSVKAVIMQQGEPVPVSTFHAENGMDVLVFSSDNPNDPDAPASMLIWAAGETEMGALEDFETRPGTNYICYIVTEDTVLPDTFVYPVHNEAEQTVTTYVIAVNRNENGYAATLDEVTVNPLVHGPDVHHE